MGFVHLNTGVFALKWSLNIYNKRWWQSKSRRQLNSFLNKQTNNKSENKNPSNNSRSLPYLNLTFLPIFSLIFTFKSLSNGHRALPLCPKYNLEKQHLHHLRTRTLGNQSPQTIKYQWTQEENKFDNMHILHQTSKCRIQSLPLNHWPILSEENYT